MEKHSKHTIKSRLKMKASHKKRLPSTQERFWFKVDKTSNSNGCWIWTANKNRGYGQFALTHTQPIQAHRYSWILKYGGIPNDLCVLHKCDNRKCVNPSHLFLGTKGDNNRDRTQKNRSAKGKLHGSRTHPEKLPRGKNHYYHLYPEKILRGEQNNSAVLTEKQVIKIKELLKQDIQQTKISKLFNVSRQVIWNIANNKTWKHIVI